MTNNYGIDPDIFKSANRHRVVAQARLIIRSLDVDRLIIPGTVFARRLMLSPSAVSKLAGRGRRDHHTKKIANRIFQALEER